MQQAKEFIDKVLTDSFYDFPDRGYLSLDWEDIPGIKYPFDYFEESGIEELISYILSKYDHINVDFNYNDTDTFPCGLILCWGHRSKEVACMLSILHSQTRRK